MWAAFHLFENIRIESRGPAYLTDFDSKSMGLIYRPTLTIQAVFSVTDSVIIIHLAAVFSFISIDYSDWKVNE